MGCNPKLLILAILAIACSGLIVPIAFAQNVQLQQCIPLESGTVQLGSTFTIYYYLSAGAQVGLGATMTNNANGQAYYDRSGDTMSNGDGPLGTRTFDTRAAGLVHGWYTLNCAIWSGMPGQSQWLGSYQVQQIIFVA
jgi:hypothetical protein